MPGYGSDQGFADYAAANGYTVPSGTVAAARARGSAYIDGTYAIYFPGVPAGGADQERAWPRSGASDLYGNAIDPSAIPKRVINASYEAALIELTTPGSLAVVTSESQRVKSLKAGSVAIDYADSSSSSAVSAAQPVSTLIEGILAPLLMPLLPGVLVV